MTGLRDAGEEVAVSAVPRRRTSFVGREQEVTDVAARVERAPVVVLLGPGGVGKTSLAYRVARRIESAGDRRVHVSELAVTFDDDAVARAVADDLGLAVTADREPADAVAARLAQEGAALLVLDNCEQVVDGAAALVDHLLDRCPELSVLVTSRVPLGVEGEQAWPVSPLGVDGDDEDGPALELLRDRAEASHPGALRGVERSVLVDLVRRLEGLPLAIELAAGRLATMGLDELIRQLDDHVLGLETSRRGAVERHRSLSAVVEWSYRLLDDDERAVAEGLSVFRGSFTRDAAITVLGLDDGSVLERLTEVSLLSVTERNGSSRLLMLEMIREFLADHLEDSGRADRLRRAHAEWAAGLALGLRSGIRGPDEALHRRLLTAELDNIGAAIEWSADAGDAELTASLVRGLFDHVLARGGREVHAWIERAAEAVWDDPVGGDVLLVGCNAAMVRGDIARYRQLMEQADALGIEGDDVVITRELEWVSLLDFEGRVDEALERSAGLVDDLSDDPWVASHRLMRLAQPYAYAGDSEGSLALMERSIALAEQTRNPTAQGWARYIEGEALMGVDAPRAIDSYEQALELARSVGNTFLAGLVSVALASALGRHGEPVEALEQFEDTLTSWRAMGGWAFLSTTLRNFGELLVRIERPEDAVLVRCALEHLEASSGAGGVDAERDRQLRRQLTERLGAERFDELQRASHDLDRDGVIDRALRTIGDELASRRPAGEFRVIVFTDLERSTEFMAGEGDAAGRERMREYDVLTDEVLARNGGERVKGTGDGVLATFGSVGAALRAVTSLARSVGEAVERGELPLRLRIGVHAGETLAEWGDVHGTVVNLAARVVDRAEAGEILVTDTVRQIAAGSSYTFTPAGTAELKGIPEPIGLHRLEWS